MLRSRPQLKGALLTLLVIALLLVGLWVWIGIRVGIWTYSEYNRHIWLVENIPIARELWRGNIQAGYNAERVIHDWNPDQITRFGPWIEMRWFPGGRHDDEISFIGICMISKNGFLVSANSYSDDRLNDWIFFNNQTTNDESDFEAAYKVYDESLQSTNRSSPNHSEANEVSSLAGSAK